MNLDRATCKQCPFHVLYVYGTVWLVIFADTNFREPVKIFAVLIFAVLLFAIIEYARALASWTAKSLQ